MHTHQYQRSCVNDENNDYSPKMKILNFLSWNLLCMKKQTPAA